MFFITTMKTSTRQKAIGSAIGMLTAILLFFSAGIKVPFMDSAADTYFRESMTKAGVAYATCRAVNASVSIVKASSLELEPAGIGVSLAIGQALDPIDDMTERLSDVLVTAITSLGVQKLAYEISLSLAFPILSVILFVLSILIWFENEPIVRLRRITLRILLFVFIARFFLPVSSLANDFIQKRFFAAQISEANQDLGLGTAELDKLKDFSLPEIDGVLGTIENSASFLKRKSFEFNQALMATVGRMGAIIENLLKLTFLYVAIFLIQVLILPLATFWLLVRLFNSLFQTNIPSLLNLSRQKQDIDRRRNPTPQNEFTAPPIPPDR